MEYTTVRQQLEALADPNYRAFQQTLLPGVDDLLGVRLPELRRLARLIAKDDWRGYLAVAPSDSFEERMLQGMVIGCAKADCTELLAYTAAFVPVIDNWSVCDSFCSGLKLPRQYPQEVWDFLQPYLSAAQTYPLRFGVVMLLLYYLDSSHIECVLTLLDAAWTETHYARMAVAWAVSMCFARFPERTMRYLTQQHTLDPETYRRALQKIVESHCVEEDWKRQIRLLRQR